jgi:hypothetical protein
MGFPSVLAFSGRLTGTCVVAVGLTTLLSLPPLPGSQLAAQQESPGGAPPVFSMLEGTWEGSGELFGRPAAFRMRWEIDAAGFVRLAFSNAFIKEDGSPSPVLAAQATYWVDDASAIGVWIDDRPQRLTLEAVITDSSVVTTWLAESETGRTEYVVHSATSVTVRDFVSGADAERLFAEATYQRVQIDADE